MASPEVALKPSATRRQRTNCFFIAFLLTRGRPGLLEDWSARDPSAEHAPNHSDLSGGMWAAWWHRCPTFLRPFGGPLPAPSPVSPTDRENAFAHAVSGAGRAPDQLWLR